MKLSKAFMLTAALLMAAGAVPALAQGRGASQRPPKVTTAQGPKARAAGKPATAPKAPNANKPTDPGGANRAERGRSDDARADRADRTDRADRADRTIAERIARNPEQKARLEALLPSGMTLAQASEGFRNQGQFIAALENSKNLNIPFASLKTEMVTNDLSLGQAIEKLKPATTTATP